MGLETYIEPLRVAGSTFKPIGVPVKVYA